ncbi:MAG: hypothetical protein COV91_00110 [Candidatus Taylorbacteria bacterium CG11_big_fil_rev_8_21_14_0_20_46_11]|uniref:ABC transporter ATP-binding protein n=1 Tax=Candidatus Taylorbacteria bacterium CG11_big_fil_rev_8_21_14_0_20_46_11 TaxID=1975025 RepID=A0A2H0KD60_9BACT|nr:MAG: hypothetical protein COV91_00110 [Candidatus Taylorbacteria bacterium CG11_big_fil_rev_8_21_14_0_20_46_11]
MYRILQAFLRVIGVRQAFIDEVPNIRTALGRIYGLYVSFRFHYLVIAILAFFLQGIAIAIPYLIKQIVDVYALGGNLTTVTLLATGLCALYFLEVPLTYVSAVYRNTHIDLLVNQHLSLYTAKRLLASSLGRLNDENSRVRQTVISAGEYAIKEIATVISSNAVPQCIRILIALFALIVVCPHIGFLILLITILYLIASIRIDAEALPELIACRVERKQMEKVFGELIGNLAFVMLNTEEKRVTNEARDTFRVYQQHEKAVWCSYWKQACFRRDPILKIGLVAILAGTIGLINLGVYSGSDFILVISWSLSLFTSLTALIPHQRRCLRYYSMVNVYFEMLDHYTDVLLKGSGVKPKHFAGKIEFTDVCFSHTVEGQNGDGSTRETISNVSFTVEEGETVAIVGSSGAGKSTLANLIVGAYTPDRGSVRVDGTDVNLLERAWFLQHVSYLTQVAHIWDHTVRRNMSFGLRLDLDDEQLGTFATKAGLHTSLQARLGDAGYDTLVGERGIRFSGGECQRIRLAAALAKNPTIIILDESTSSLDNKTDAFVQQSLREELRGRTAVIIAHRLSTIRHVDKIIVLDAGSVAGIGNHNTLLTSCKEYAQLVEHELRF